MAEALAASGARVAVTARSADQLHETIDLIQEAGGQALAVAGDVGEAADVARVIGACRRELGPVDL